MSNHAERIPAGGRQRFLGKDSHKMALLVLLILLCVGTTYYYHFILGRVVVFSHLFYLPIALAGFWWGRRGAWVAVFLAVLLSVSHLLSRLDVPYEEGLFRSAMFVAVGLTVGFLREQAVHWEKNLRETRDYLDSLIHYANAPIIVWDVQGNITRFNAACERLTDYKAGEIIGQKLQVLFPEVSRDESLRKIARTLSGEHWESVEIPILRQDGESRLVLWNSANIYAEDGTTLLATIAQGQDITERKAAEDALAASKSYTESIIQNFLDTLIVVDAEAKIQTVNPATCRLLGYTEEELKGQSVSMLFAEEEEEEEEEEVMRVFQFFREPEKAKTPHPQDTIRNRELTYKTKDGRLIPMLFNASMLTDEVGHVTGVVAGAKDITDIKQAEEAKRIVEVKFRNVIENIFKFVPEGLLVLTDKLNVFRRNKAFEDLVHQYAEKLDYTEDELADIINEQVKMRVASGEKSDIIIAHKR